MDPHTAVASYVQREYGLQTGDFAQTVILSTASPYKFAGDVLAALQGKDAVKGLNAFQCAEALQKLTGVPIPKQITALQSMPERHRAVCEIDDMQAAMLRELQS